MNLLEFNNRFKDEKDCKEYLKDLRLKYGITCTMCQEKTHHYWLESVEKFQCSVCRSRTNLKAGTIMYKSKMPLSLWFLTIHLMTSTKKPFSALELQRQLGYKFYEPVWDMMRKIRLSMGNRDAKYTLKGNIEIDEGYFVVVDLPERDTLGNIIDVKLKRGVGSQRQTPVLVMVESKPIQDKEKVKKHNKGRVMGYVKMIVMDDTVNNIGLNYLIGKSVDRNSHVLTDGNRGYSRVTDVVNGHTSIVMRDPKDASKKLPWVHTVISNAKRQFIGTHHSIGKEYLQAYLNEFCWKLNRRNFEVDLFDRMLIAGSQDTWF